MKSLAELEAIRKATLSRINVRTEDKDEATRVVIGMATATTAIVTSRVVSSRPATSTKLLPTTSRRTSAICSTTVWTLTNQQV